MPIVEWYGRAEYIRHSRNTSYGFVSEFDDRYDLDSSYRYRAWSRQSRPYITTLPYVNLQVDCMPVGYWIRETSPAYSAESIRTGWAGVKSDYLLGLASALDDTQQLEEAMNGAFDNIQGATWNFPVFAAEAHKTFDSVHALAQKANKGWSYLTKLRRQPKALRHAMENLWLRSWWDSSKRMRRKEVRYGTDDVAKSWLMYRYEIMTGLMDIRDAAETCADLLLAQPETVVAKARRTTAVGLPVHHVGYGVWDPPFLLGIGAGANLHFYRNASAQVTCSAWMRVRRTNPVLSEANQLGLLNWPSNVWEVLPGSFIADWTLDIGNYLERLPALCGLQIVDAGYSTYRRVGGTITASVASDYWTERELEIQPLEFEVRHYQRSPWVNPAPVWTPSIRLSRNRLLDAAALFRNLGPGYFKK